MSSALANVLDSCAEGAPAAATQSATDQIKVLHLINGDLYAGAERVQDLLALRMRDFGFELAFAALKRGRFADDRRSQDVPLFDVGMRSRFDVGVVGRVARIIRDGRYRLLHTHTPRTAVVGRFASRLAGVPHVHHLHSPAGAESKQAWRNHLNAWVERFGVRRASAFISVSESVAEHTRRDQLSSAPIFVVHNGVPVQGPLDGRTPPRDTWTLSMAALFRPRKGLEVLLRSVALLRSQGLDVRLRAIGGFCSTDYEAEMHALEAELCLHGAIDWVGFSRDVIGEMRRTDLFVLPSLFGEGLPMVVLEAMSAGVPVVATRVEGTPEAVRDRIDGLLAEPGDPQDLARAIGLLVRGQVDWSALRKAAHERQANSFSDVSMTAGVARVYRRLLDVAE